MENLEQELQSLLYQAFGSEHGIVVRVSDVTLAKQRLYKARKNAGDADLMTLKLETSPVLPEEEIWITHAKEGKREADPALNIPVSG